MAPRKTDWTRAPRSHGRRAAALNGSFGLRRPSVCKPVGKSKARHRAVARFEKLSALYRFALSASAASWRARLIALLILRWKRAGTPVARRGRILPFSVT